jgi:hypothetical protein
MSYSQWFLAALPQLAREAFAAFAATGCGRHHVYYRPHGLAFAVIQDGGEVPADMVLATGEHVPPNLDRAQLVRWFHARLSNVPVFPTE